jgi:uncharacterized protein YfaA (DUF2138 family)
VGSFEAGRSGWFSNPLSLIGLIATIHKGKVTNRSKLESRNLEAKMTLSSFVIPAKAESMVPRDVLDSGFLRDVLSLE